MLTLLLLRKFECLLYEYYLRFSKIRKNIAHLNQFHVLLYDRVPNLKYFIRTDKIPKNTNVLQVRTDKNPTTALYSEATKSADFSDETRTIKKVKITKRAHDIKNYAHSYNVEILNPKILNLHLKIN